MGLSVFCIYQSAHGNLSIFGNVASDSVLLHGKLVQEERALHVRVFEVLRRSHLGSLICLIVEHLGLFTFLLQKAMEDAGLVHQRVEALGWLNLKHRWCLQVFIMGVRRSFLELIDPTGIKLIQLRRHLVVDQARQDLVCILYLSQRKHV